MAHYKTTAPEIETTLKNNNLGNLDIFVAGAGTGWYHYGCQSLLFF